MNTFQIAMVLAASLAMASPAIAQDSDSSPLAGVWRMTSLEVGNAAGELEPIEYSGQIVFSDVGTMSVQAMNPDTDAPDSAYTWGSYEAFYGTYVVDGEADTFVVTVESALVRAMIGQDFERAFEVTADRLVLTPTDPGETWRVTYERMSS